jgi:hypothetical protein
LIHIAVQSSELHSSKRSIQREEHVMPTTPATKASVFGEYNLDVSATGKSSSFPTPPALPLIRFTGLVYVTGPGGDQHAVFFAATDGAGADNSSTMIAGNDMKGAKLTFENGFGTFSQIPIVADQLYITIAYQGVRDVAPHQ